MSIIDAHLHLWKAGQFRRDWLSGPLAHDFTLDDYAAATRGLSLESAVYLETGVAAHDRAAEGRWILELQKREKRIAGVVLSGDPHDETFADFLAALSADPGVKGVRPVISRQANVSPLLNDAFVWAAQILGERGLCCDLLIGTDELAEAATLAERCPETRFVLDHCGGPGPDLSHREAWKRGIAALAHRPNIFCKISGIVGASPTGVPSAQTLAPLVRHCAETFGPERLIFGSDWPVCTLYASVSQWVGILRELVADWDEADKRRLFRENAIRVYRLDAA